MADKERYDFTRWGKKDAIKLALAQTTGTLRPDKKSSKDWDTTQNLYIEGDNLEVLRTLQESYRNKVKMLYLDPPYNTGKDFVYEDNFVDNVTSYKEKMNENLKSNPETSGRYHTDWLNMMYPRLRLGRNLLKKDGVIFINIGINELANLKKVGDEIFGEENLLAIMPRETKKWANRWTHFAPAVDYIIAYAKSILDLPQFFEPVTQEYIDWFKLDDNDWRWFFKKVWLYEPTLDYYENCRFEIKCPDWDIVITPEDKSFRCNKESFQEALEKNEIVFDKKESKLENLDWSKAKRAISQKLYLNDMLKKWRRPSDLILNYINALWTKSLTKLWMKFSFSKPVELLRYLIQITENPNEETKNDLIMDFFSWSAATAHAVMELNALDDRSRRFIMIQIPEKLDPKKKDEKLICKFLESIKKDLLITEIWKERIRRAGEKIKEENKDKARINKLDIWFKCLTLDTTNLKKRDTNPTDIKASLLDIATPLKGDRSQEDMLYEIMLKNGMDLTLPIETETINGKQVSNVAGNYLIVCLEKDVSMDVIKEIANRQPKVVVLYDESFKDDMTKLNALEQLTKSWKDEDKIQVRVI